MRYFTFKRFICRRHRKRKQVQTAETVCWTNFESPEKAVVIEADRRGARLILPWPVEKDEQIAVSFSNDVGLYRTEKARVAWTQTLETSGKTVVGLCYLNAA